MSQRSPKRRIERVFSRIVDADIAATVTDFTLHSAEDSKTLIRIMGEFIVTPIDAALTTFKNGECVISIKPRSATVALAPASATQNLDQDVPTEEIARFPFAALFNNTNGTSVLFHRMFDIKAMRKMKPGDLVTLGVIADTAGDLKFVATIYLWFKE